MLLTAISLPFSDIISEIWLCFETTTSWPPILLALTRPVRLGLPPTLEATELTELMDELLGLWASDDTPMATRLLFLALAGLVDGKPMRITLWMGANRPNLGGHWKYLKEGKGWEGQRRWKGSSDVELGSRGRKLLLTHSFLSDFSLLSNLINQMQTILNR